MGTMLIYGLITVMGLLYGAIFRKKITYINTPSSQIQDTVRNRMLGIHFSASFLLSVGILQWLIRYWFPIYYQYIGDHDLYIPVIIAGFLVLFFPIGAAIQRYLTLNNNYVKTANEILENPEQLLSIKNASEYEVLRSTEFWSIIEEAKPDIGNRMQYEETLKKLFASKDAEWLLRFYLSILELRPLLDNENMRRVYVYMFRKFDIDAYEATLQYIISMGSEHYQAISKNTDHLSFVIPAHFVHNCSLTKSLSAAYFDKQGQHLDFAFFDYEIPLPISPLIPEFKSYQDIQKDFPNIYALYA